VNEKKKTGKRK